jgi:hypothetical protein
MLGLLRLFTNKGVVKWQTTTPSPRYQRVTGGKFVNFLKKPYRRWLIRST